MATKMLGRGAKLYYGNTGSPSGFVQVPSVKTIGEIRKTSPKVDVTDLDDTAHAYLGGLPDPSTINIDGYWMPDNSVHQQMDADQRAATVRYWKIEVYRSGGLVRTGTFQGYVAEFGSGPFDYDNPVAMPMVIQMSGDITWA